MLFIFVSTDIKGPNVLEVNIPQIIIPHPRAWKFVICRIGPWFRAFCALFGSCHLKIEQETRFIGPGYFFPVLMWPISTFLSQQQVPFPIFCDTRCTFHGLLLLKPIIRKFCLVMRWDMFALIACVVCRVVSFLLLWSIHATRLSPV